MRTILTAISVFVLFPFLLCASESESVTDTDLHILAGVAASLGSASVFLFATEAEYWSLPTIAAVAAAAAVVGGIGKELVDELGLGTPELRDIYNTAIGGLIGIAMLTYSLLAFPPAPVTSGLELRYTFLTIGVALSLPLFRYIIPEQK